MMKILNRFLFLPLLLCAALASAQTNRALVQLSRGDKEYIFVACLETMAADAGTLAVAHPPISTEEDQVNELVIVIRRKTKRGYSKVFASIHNRPILSNDTAAVTRTGPLIDTLDLRQHYILYRGDYRIKVLRKVWINGREAILSSRWVDFHVEEKVEATTS